MRRRKGAGLLCLATTGVLCLSGCLTGGTDGVDVQRGQPNFTAQEADESLVISSLYKRNSVIPSGSAYHKVAQSVLAANSRSSEAELRSARLRQVAADKNWLPTIGPQVSLTSLGNVVAQMVV
jgi:adhesin transport system outer membrane protein